MKGVFVILDGVADEQHFALGGKTPLEAARTPNLDEIANKSEIGYCYTVKEEYVPESHEAILSLLGYDFREIQRGALEAQGLGIKLRAGDLAFRCNFATIDDLEHGNIIDRRAGRTLTTEEARILAKAINENVKLRFPFEFYPGMQHRAVLVIRGRFSNNIKNVEDVKGKLVFSESLDDEEESKLSAEIVNSFVRQSFEILDKQVLNKKRARFGFYLANVILCRGASNKPARLKKLKEKWAGLVYAPLEIAIAKTSGMDVRTFKYPKMRKADVYDNLYKGLSKAIFHAKLVLLWKKKKYDYFFIHFKETDIPGHDGKPMDKVRMIEILDDKFFSFLKKFTKDTKIIITADHATSCRKKMHTSGAVPFLYSNPAGNGKSSGIRFTEEQGMKGKKLISRQILAKTFYAK